MMMKRFMLVVLVMLAEFSFTAVSQEIQTIDLRVMTFNVWVGGELVDFGKVIEAIQASEADIVGLQEPGGNTPRIARDLGWTHYSERMHIVSRFPLLEVSDSDGIYLFVQLRPGQVVAVANTHLPSDPYGPYMLRDGETLEAALANEAETRLPAIEPFVEVLSNIAETYPVLFTGDFNTPSHLDWTEAQVGVVEHVQFPVAWPVTQTLEDAGFTDAYRSVYPDPAEHVGMTWTPGYPFPRLRDGEVFDRIDYVFVGGAAEVIDVQIVGEPGGPDVDIEVDPYPSDHRGVVATVRVLPAAPPMMAAVQRRVITQGEDIVVYYAAPVGEEEDRLVIVPAGGTAAEDAIMSLPPMEADFYGAVTFGSQMMTPGEYAAVLINGAGEELSRSQFWVLAPGAVPQLQTDKARYSVDETVQVIWENAPGNRFDWLGVYKAGDSDLYNYLSFEYVDAASAGTLEMDLAEFAPGEYEVRLMRDDWFVLLATVTVTVTE